MIVSFGAQSFLIVINSNLSNFSFTTHAFGDSAGKESACKAGHLGSIPGLGRSPGEGKGYSLQYSGPENSVDCIVHGGHREGDTTEWLSLSLHIYIYDCTDLFQRSDVSAF